MANRRRVDSAGVQREWCGDCEYYTTHLSSFDTRTLDDAYSLSGKMLPQFIVGIDLSRAWPVAFCASPTRPCSSVGLRQDPRAVLHLLGLPSNRMAYFHPPNITAGMVCENVMNLGK